MGNKNYCERIVDETRQAFLDFENSTLSSLELIYMKTIDKRFATINAEDVRSKIWRLKSFGMKNTVVFETLEDLLSDGWIVD